jgi:hypothetical protein
MQDGDPFELPWAISQTTSSAILHVQISVGGWDA